MGDELRRLSTRTMAEVRLTSGDWMSPPVGPFRVELHDGSHVMLRRVAPDDLPRLRRLFDNLSSRSRYLRFHSHKPEIAPDELRAIALIEPTDGSAWMATDPDGEVIGLASYHRSQATPSVAEAAVVVTDERQGVGLGTALLETLVRDARSKRVQTFRNYVLSENHRLLEFFDQLGASRQPLTARVQEVDLDLPEWGSPLAHSPAGRALGAVARRLQGSFLASLHPPLWRHVPDAASTAAGGRERAELAEWMDATFEKRRLVEDVPHEAPPVRPAGVARRPVVSADTAHRSTSNPNRGSPRKVPPT